MKNIEEVKLILPAPRTKLKNNNEACLHLEKKRLILKVYSLMVLFFYKKKRLSSLLWGQVVNQKGNLFSSSFLKLEEEMKFLL
jgi:hypothetical protein